MRTDLIGARSPDPWIGPAPARRAIAALLIVGTVGMMITGVQPVVFGALVREGRLSVTELGWVTTAEFLALGIGVTLAGGALRPRYLRAYAVAAGLAVIVANLAATRHAGLLLIADRTLAGFAEGIMLWLPVCMIARSSRSAFWSGIFITIQTLAQLVFAAVTPPTVLVHFGANGALMSLAVTGAIAIAVAPLLPSRFGDLPKPSSEESPTLVRQTSSISWSGIVALSAMFLTAAFQIGLYAYFEPLAAQAGHDERVLAFAVTAALGAQLLGSTLAALFARHVRHFHVLIAWAVTNLGLLAVFNSMPDAFAFVGACAAFGFVWLFFMPFQFPLMIEADPSRRAAVLLPGAQLLGGAAGPFLCSLVVHDADVRGALVVCGVFILAAGAISTAVHLRRRRPA
jgi:MFS family permease